MATASHAVSITSDAVDSIKHRNAMVFNNELPSVTSVVDSIKAEARYWADAGARGLCHILP